MTYSKVFPRLLFVALLLAPLTLLHARPQAGTTAPTGTPDGAPTDATSIAGELLVATPEIGDPRFAHAVIVMISHDHDGAFGLTINRPVGSHPIAELLDAVGAKHDRVKGQIPIYAGGPNQEQIGFVLHSLDYRDTHTKTIGKGIALTSSMTILRDMGHGKGPRKALMAFGYAGWLPGQLEAELDKRAWVTAPLDANLIFNTDPDKIWDLAWAHRMLSI